MAVSETETKYPLTTDFIYSVCAKRLKERKMALRMTDAEIVAGGYDRKVVNRIINGTRTRNNPFLVPPAYVRPLVAALRFESDCELYWGATDDESFVEPLFFKLVSDIQDESDENADIIKRVLLDDVHYAKVFQTRLKHYCCNLLYVVTSLIGE